MAHGDDQGLVLPPKIATIQVVIIPIFKNDMEKTEVMPVVEQVKSTLGDFRIHIDDRTEVTPGFKFNDWEMRGVPLRIEIGPKDVEKGTVAFARRDIPGKAGKSFVPQTQLLDQVGEVLADIQNSMHDKALAFRDANTHSPKDYDDFREVVRSGWALSWWCGNPDCEAKIKEETKATTRCIPFEQPGGSGNCIYCNQPAEEKVYFSRAY